MKLIRITTVPISLEKLIGGQMCFMNENGFEVFMISSFTENSKIIEKREKSKYITINMSRKISLLKDISSFIRLCIKLRQLKPLIVHTHTPKAGLLGMLASKLVGVPVRLHTVAGLPLMEKTGYLKKILIGMEKLTYACATMVYPNSKNLQAFIEKSKFVRKDKLKVIGNGSSNGINTNEFQLNDEIKKKAEKLKLELGFVATDFVFVFVGRLVKDKGIEELVNAFAKLSENNIRLKLLLVGPEEPQLDALSVECLAMIKQHSQIIHVGYQHDVRPYLAISNALAFPSYREGFPNVPMQAGCFNLPAIVTDINGCNEIIIPNENGLIIPVKNAQALQEAMERLFIDTELYQHMVNNARKMIVERFEQEKIWELILTEYTQHLKKINFV